MELKVNTKSTYSDGQLKIEFDFNDELVSATNSPISNFITAESDLIVDSNKIKEGETFVQLLFDFDIISEESESNLVIKSDMEAYFNSNDELILEYDE